MNYKMHTSFKKYICCSILVITLAAQECITTTDEHRDRLNKHIMLGLLKTAPQDCSLFIESSQGDFPVVPYDTTQVMQCFLHFYFSPWDRPSISFTIEELKDKQQNRIKEILEKPGVGINRYPIEQSIPTFISSNMYLDTFPNLQQQAAIIPSGTNLRVVPSNTSSFTMAYSDGEGYPFDNWQESYLITNEPLCVLHQSKDKEWCFVVTGSHNFGWVKRKDIAYASPSFIEKWKTGKYVTPLYDSLAVERKGFSPSPCARIGQLIPLSKTQNSTEKYNILTVVTNSEGYAEIKEALVSKQETTVMPLVATPNNMARLANQLMGQPYGWGGLEGYRDCSALTKDLLMPFGIWMPRDSGPQAQTGELIELKGFGEVQRKQQIISLGKPFFSLVTAPGQVALYLGVHKEERPCVYRSMWGLYTGINTRAIIGRTVVIPVDFGKEYSEVQGTLLDKANGILMLHDRLTHPEKALPLFTAQK